MTKIHHILVATDFSSSADAAVGRAVQLAVAHDASLCLFHACEAHTLTRDAAPEEPLQQRLSSMAASISAQAGIAVDVQFGVGPPAAAIADCARSQAVSLVLVGARADPDLAGLGSTASKVVRSPASPVLVVRAAPSKSIDRVLSAVDLRAGSVYALSFALTLFPAARHRLLYALAQALDDTEQTGEPDPQGPSSPQASKHEAAHALAERELRQLAQRLSDQARHPLTAEVADDLPERAILVGASVWPADCVVVGHRGERSTRDAIPGNMAQHVMQYTTVDLLVVP